MKNSLASRRAPIYSVPGASRRTHHHSTLHAGTWLSEAYLLADRKEDALALAQRALERSREQRERRHQVSALRLLGETAAQRHPPEITQAAAHYQQALGETLGMCQLQTHCHHCPMDMTF